MRSLLSIATGVTLFLSLAIHPSSANAQTPRISVETPTPTTPIQHVVVIFGENISFDHYFATYPKAVNPPGQPKFFALPGTPAVNGLTGTLLTDNPNFTNTANGTGAANPFRFNRDQALTADMNHSDAPEQEAYDLGALDLFPKFTGAAGGTTILTPPAVATKGEVMGYFDGNTVTAMWNYAQNFALNDNHFNTQFGPSSPGAINLISGQTNGIIASTNAPSSDQIADGQGGFTLVGDAEPLDDVCSKSTSFNAELSGKNVGDLLNNAGLTWGWFQGGFNLSTVNPNGTTGCKRSTVSPITGLTEGDYVEHHQPFQYYANTRNPSHLRPTSLSTIGSTDAANHQYDSLDWFNALAAGNLPAVSFLKAPSYQDAHPGNSNPLDEQAFVVNVINTLEQSPFWSTTAVIIDYDDSDGWYDHQMAAIANGSFTTDDSVSGPNACGVSGTTAQLPGPNSGGAPVQGRCMYGPRTPLLVISPWAKPNFVDHTLTNQASVLLFIEQNWNLGLIGGGSADAISNPINNMFNFSESTPQNTNAPILSTITGQPE
jgi:phospholipase C